MTLETKPIYGYPSIQNHKIHKQIYNASTDYMKKSWIINTNIKQNNTSKWSSQQLKEIDIDLDWLWLLVELTTQTHIHKHIYNHLYIYTEKIRLKIIKYMQKYKYFYMYLQIYTNSCPSLSIYTIYKHIQTYTNTYKHIETHTNTYKHIQHIILRETMFFHVPSTCANTFSHIISFYLFSSRSCFSFTEHSWWIKLFEQLVCLRFDPRWCRASRWFNDHLSPLKAASKNLRGLHPSLCTIVFMLNIILLFDYHI